MAESDDESRHLQTKPGCATAERSPKKAEKFKFGRCSENVSTDSTDDESSDSDSSSSDITLPPPPDGGWGWVIVAASFMIHFVADGCAFSFGVLYTELLDYFKESKGKTAWVGSLFVSVPLLAGPIASALTNKYGCRMITMIGAMVASVGFICGAFSNSTEMLCLTFGIISGFGLSMVYVPAVVIVAFYFEKRRAFATGIAVAGSGIGNCIFAPLIDVLIQKYTWRGAVLLLGAVMLQMVACGALFRPLVPPSVEKKRIRSRLASERSSRSRISSNRQSLDDVRVGCSMTCPDDHNVHLMTHSMVQFPTFVNKKTMFITPDLLQDLKQNGKSIHEYLAENNLLEKFYAIHSVSDCSSGGALPDGVGGEGGFGVEDNEGEGEDVEPETGIGRNRSFSNNHPGNNVQKNDNYLPGKVHSPCGSNGHATLALNDVTILSEELPPSRKTVKTPATKFEAVKKPVRTGCVSAARADELWMEKVRPRFKRAEVQGQFLQPLARKDIFYRGNLLRPGAFFSGRAASCPDVFISKPTEEAGDTTCYDRFKVLSLLQISKEVKHIMRQMLDLSILKSVIFNYFCLSCTFLYMSYDVPYIYTVDKAVHELKIGEDRASLLLSIIGLTSTFGQIVIGYIGDQSYIDTLHLYNALTSIAGICTMLVPLMMTYTSLAIYCGAYGFFISANYALTTIILVDLLGMDKLTNAYGIVMLAEGVANVIGPPIAGWLSDYTGAYDLTFIIAGAIMVLSGVMLFAIPCLRRCERRNGSDSENSSKSPSQSDPHLFLSTEV